MDISDISNGLLKSFFTSSIVKGPGIKDLIQTIQHQFYKHADETDEDFATRECIEMMDVVTTKSPTDWLSDPHSFRMYVLEVWGRLFQFEKDHNSDKDIRESYKTAYEKLKYCNIHINIIPLKDFMIFKDKHKYVKMIYEYYIMWSYGIFIMLSYAVTGSLVEYNPDIVEIDEFNLFNDMSKEFHTKLNLVVDTTNRLLEAVSG